MGYNLHIGEAEPTIYMEDRVAYMGVKYVELDEAPVNSERNRSNRCSPGYLVWAKFCRTVGLWSVFYAPESPDGKGGSVYWVPEGGLAREGLLSRDHPGAKVLTPHHLAAFKKARDRWLEDPEADRLGEDRVDWVLRRLEWLVFWTEWALENCKYPSFATS